MPLSFDSNWNLSSIAPSPIGSNTNDWNPTGLAGASLIWLTATASFNLTGLDGGEERRLMFIGLRQTSTSFTVSIIANSASSAVGKRFADAVSMNMGGSGKIITAWIYLGGIWRRWRF